MSDASDIPPSPPSEAPFMAASRPHGQYPFEDFRLDVKMHPDDLSFFLFLCRQKKIGHAEAVASMVGFCLRLFADGGLGKDATLVDDLHFKVGHLRELLARANLILSGAEKVLLDSQAVVAGVRNRLLADAADTSGADMAEGDENAPQRSVHQGPSLTH